MSTTDRRRDFKKGISADNSRRRREETTVVLRKNKREDSLNKRRSLRPPPDHTDADAPSATRGSVAVASGRVFRLEDLPELLTGLHSADDTAALTSLTGLRKLLSTDKPPVDEVIEAGALPLLVSFLKRNGQSTMQFEAAWALTNIASSSRTMECAQCGDCVATLTALLMHENADVRDQCAWCLGNIAGDGPTLRDACYEHCNPLPGLLLNVQQPANPTLLRNCVWAISNFSRGKPAPALELTSPAVPVLVQMLSNVDEEVVADAAWSLSYLSDGANERIDVVVKSGAVQPLVAALRSTNSKIITPVLRALGNIVTGDDSQTQATIDHGVLPILNDLLSHSSKGIRKEVCWMLSNIGAGNAAQISQLVKTPGVLSGVVRLAESAEWEVMKEALYTLSNIASGGRKEHKKLLCDHGAVKALCESLEVEDPRILLVILDGLDGILKACGEEAVTLVENSGGIDMIEKLQDAENIKVYEKALEMVKNYFNEEGDNDIENLAPVQDKAGGYTFGGVSQTAPIGGFNFN